MGLLSWLISRGDVDEPGWVRRLVIPRGHGPDPRVEQIKRAAEEDVAEAHQRQQEGFEFFKLKIGVKPLAKEIAIAFAVREALPKTPLCADANCGLTLADARKYAEKTRKAKLKNRRLKRVKKRKNRQKKSYIMKLLSLKVRKR